MSGEDLDIHDSLLTGYSVHGVNGTLVMHTQPHQGGGTAWIDVIFRGVAAYHFDGDCLQNIVFEIDEIPAATVANAHEFEECFFERGKLTPRAWAEQLIDRARVSSPDALVFFDDLAATVEAARAAGMRAYQVRGVDELRARLIDEALL